MKAQLENGQIIEYHPQMIGEGTMKQVYLSKDKEFVLCFYKTKTDAFRRLQKIINEFNPTRKDYWNRLYCWPTNIIIKPKLGVMTPLYPTNYTFSTGRWKGKEKKSRWFISPKLRQYLPKEEQASWINYFKICILLARAVNRLHLAGLAHSDLSDNNVLIDPSAGKMIIIDIDSLVVPQIFPPQVDGTPGYIAPEVLAKPPQLANICTDQHALAVLIYEYLLKRHPLRGPKINSTHSAEKDEQLSMGEKALFIEHPQDNSNHPKEKLKVPVTALGSTLTKLFYKAFVTGLHSPDERPTAYQWEKSLTKTWNMLHPCPNPNCSHQWFIVIPEQKQIHCPFCQTPIKAAFPLLTIRSRQWQESVQMVVYEGQSLFKWHVFDNIFPGPDADRRPQAYCAFYQGKWLLINQALKSLISPNGHRIEINQAVELKEGVQISLTQEAHGCNIEVSIVH
ncbi:serine/threonine protein kinase [Candidatus Thiomargarita nelsonii]|uniref:Serine/threonine protein kinase n=1 Tax=Candidatus Thiomargarita nelsonii TaxID=1003181 RepID=A0A0A6PA82_9GAMM|nr:serine/threonine protein kinase [Candidatus Thiomargarita nelsonii]